MNLHGSVLCSLCHKFVFANNSKAGMQPIDTGLNEAKSPHVTTTEQMTDNIVLRGQPNKWAEAK